MQKFRSIRSLFRSFFLSDWTVTLIATMLGVFAAIILDGYFEEKSLVEDQKDALLKVEKELADNESELQVYHDDLQEKHDSFQFIFSVVNDSMDIILPINEISEFRLKTRSFFEMTDSTLLRNGMYKISGDMNFNIESKLIISPLSSVTWNTYKQTNYLSVTSFDCLSDMELIYNIQEEVNAINKVWSSMFFKGSYISDPVTRDEFLTVWDNLLMHQKLLFDLYQSRDETLKSCY